ncbi:MAG: hypothetical protein B7Z73_00935, partial [Planctomycetia bacterium 21-64-5]
MFASKRLFGRSRSTHSRRNQRRLGRFESLEDRRMFSADAPTASETITGNTAFISLHASATSQASAGASGNQTRSDATANDAPYIAVPLSTANAEGTETLTPQQARHAYGLDSIVSQGQSLDGSGQTIAIVDAYNDPSIWGDVAHFNAEFGLPPLEYKESWFELNGQKPPADAGWAGETALDVEWAHAMAPGATILLIHSWDQSPAEYFKAVGWAAQQPGVSAVSMSYGSPEFAAESAFDGDLTTPSGHNGVTFVAASGDRDATHGYQSNDDTGRYPSSSPNVVSVGATALTADASGDWLGEDADPISGGGISPYESEPFYQRDAGITDWIGSLTGMRSTPDVALTDHSSDGIGLPVYDSYDSSNPYLSVWGTSAAAPEFAGLVAVADEGRTLAGEGTLASEMTLGLLYMLNSSFHNITQMAAIQDGNPAFAPRPGYDNVTGLGTPIGNILVPQLIAGGFLSLTPGSSTGNLDVNVGSTINQELATFDDPNGELSPGNYMATINWGDSTTTAGTIGVDANGNLAVYGSHQYSSDGTYAIDVDIHSPRGGSDALVEVNADVSTPPVQITGDLPVNLSAGNDTVNQALVTFVDPAGADAPSNYQATIYWGDNQSSAGTVNFDSSSDQFVVSGEHTYAGAGTYTVTVDVVHGNSPSAGSFFQITVTDPPFELQGGFTISATEGQAFRNQVVATFTDPMNAGGYLANVDFGDGSSAAGEVVAEGGGVYDVLASHTYTSDQPTEAIGVSVVRTVDGQAATVESEADVTVPPLQATGGYTINATAGAGFSQQLVATFVDPSGDETMGDYSAQINWGDGQTSAGTLVPDPSNGFDVLGDHQYSSAGMFTIEVSIQHGPTATASAASTAEASQPSLTPNEQYVTAIYQALLSRAPTAQELQSWSGQLDGGLDREVFVNAIDHSDEYFATIIEPAYEQYLGRAADAAGIDYWTSLMRQGLTDQQLEADFIGSEEFYDKAGGTDLDWVDAMYQDLLGRPADA